MAERGMVVSTCNQGGFIHGREHLSMDDGRSTLCGIRDRLDGGRSNIVGLGIAWAAAYKCKRCARSRAALEGGTE